MTHTPYWLRTAHRIHAGLTIIVVVTLLVLNLNDVLDAGTALRLFLAIEVPLLVVFIAITVVRFKHADRSTAAKSQGFLARLEAEEPLLGPAIMELRAIKSLFLAMRKKRQIPQGAKPFGYTKGTLTFPLMLAAISVPELVIVHVLVPWQWLQIVLLILTVWGVVFVCGFFALRVVHPHFITAHEIHLRWGYQTVLISSLANVQSAERVRKHTHTYPHAERDRLVLAQSQAPNVVLRFATPVAADPPVSKKHLPVNFQASEVRLYVDDPELLLQTLAARNEGVKP